MDGRSPFPPSLTQSNAGLNPCARIMPHPSPTRNALRSGFDWPFVALNCGKLAGDLPLVRPWRSAQWANGKQKAEEIPIEFEGPTRDTDNPEIKVPDGYVVDELPPTTDIEYNFGS